jgi:hypothetical protein
VCLADGASRAAHREDAVAYVVVGLGLFQERREIEENRGEIGVPALPTVDVLEGAEQIVDFFDRVSIGWR